MTPRSSRRRTSRSGSGIYHERNQSLKIAMMRRRRAKFDEFWALRGRVVRGRAGHDRSAWSATTGPASRRCSRSSPRSSCPTVAASPSTGKVSALLELGAGFHPELSGRDNVYLNGSILGLRKEEITRRFDDIVGFAGLEHFIDTPVKNYSSGMYVRLGFSVAINVDPDILMVDEVLAVGDEEFQRKCMEKFKDFKDEGRTIVVVSHALGTMRDLCDEVALARPRPAASASASRRRRRRVLDERRTRTARSSRRVPTGDAGHGSGEIRVERVELLHGGESAARLHTGDT